LKFEMIERRKLTMAAKDLFPRINDRAPVARSSSVNPLLSVHNGSLFPDIANQRLNRTHLSLWFRALSLGALAMLAGCVEPPPRQYVVPAEPAPPIAQTRIIVYPVQGQSPQQLEKDRYECHVWAVQQSGFDPSQPGVPATQRVIVQPANPPGTGTAVGAIAGAILGAAIAGPRETGAGLVVGGITGAAVGAASDTNAQAQAQAEQQRLNQGFAQSYAQMQAAASNYRRAISACLTARGYTLG
jgi:hypothetical protein